MARQSMEFSSPDMESLGLKDHRKSTGEDGITACRPSEGAFFEVDKPPPDQSYNGLGHCMRCERHSHVYRLNDVVLCEACWVRQNSLTGGGKQPSPAGGGKQPSPSSASPMVGVGVNVP